MTLLDKVLARPLEPGSKTKQDESTVAEAAVARHERERRSCHVDGIIVSVSCVVSR